MAKLALLGGRPVLKPSDPKPHWPVHDQRDRKRLLQVLDDGRWGIGGPMSCDLAMALSKYTGQKYALPVATGTAALELIIKALGIVPGDEVIVPAYTFIASATCALELGATIVFADIDPQTLNLDPADVAKKITPRTRAIVAVHFAGNPVDLAGLKKITRGKDIAIIEDAAHAHGLRYRGKAPGGTTAAAAYSYQSTKNMSSGEGGAITTNRKKLYDHALSFHSFGRLPGKPWYDHHVMSWNYRLSGFQAAILLGQLERLDEQNLRRATNAAQLDAAIAQLDGLMPQRIGDTHKDTRRVHHIYIFQHDAKVLGIPRARFMQALEAEGVPCFGGYPKPLHEAPMFREGRYWHHQFMGPAGKGEPRYDKVVTPHASALCQRAIWLEQKLLLGDAAFTGKLVDAIVKVYENRDQLQSPRRGGRR